MKKRQLGDGDKRLIIPTMSNNPLSLNAHNSGKYQNFYFHFPVHTTSFRFCQIHHRTIAGNSISDDTGFDKAFPLVAEIVHMANVTTNRSETPNTTR